MKGVSILKNKETECFEDAFFDDMVLDIEKLWTTKPQGRFDAGWNAAIKSCLCKLHSFFGRKLPVNAAMDTFCRILAVDTDEVNFDELIADIMKIRATNPSREREFDKAWNLAVHVCIIRLYKFFGKGQPPTEISQLFLDSICVPNTDTDTEMEGTGCTGCLEHSEHSEAPKPEIKPLVHYPINHPDYYCAGGLEVIDYIEAKNFPYHLGSAIKYISRAGRKNPDKTVEDLKKAVWYLERYIDLLNKGGSSDSDADANKS